MLDRSREAGNLTTSRKPLLVNDLKYTTSGYPVSGEGLRDSFRVGICDSPVHSYYGTIFMKGSPSTILHR